MICTNGKETLNESEIDTPNLLPLLDILFMLIVFFLLTANSVQQVLKLDLPEHGSDQSEALIADQPIKLYLFAGEPRWQLGDETYYQWSDIERNLQNIYAADSNRKLIIIGDKNAPMERMLQLLAFLKSEGRSAAQILMKPEEK